MNREQLEMLGEAGLRQMARQVGIRGARHHHRSLLITGLAAYFARRPTDDRSEPETDDEPYAETSLSATEIPPALATETMARLLESQGKTAQALALRARLDRTPHQYAAPAVRMEHSTALGIELVWEGAEGARRGLVPRPGKAFRVFGEGRAPRARRDEDAYREYSTEEQRSHRRSEPSIAGTDFRGVVLVVRLWTPDAAPTQWELPVTTPQGRMRFDPPPNTTRMCAALGQLSPDGFVPSARSAIIVLGDERSP